MTPPNLLSIEEEIEAPKDIMQMEDLLLEDSEEVAIAENKSDRIGLIGNGFQNQL